MFIEIQGRDGLSCAFPGPSPDTNGQYLRCCDVLQSSSLCESGKLEGVGKGEGPVFLVFTVS